MLAVANQSAGSGRVLRSNKGTAFLGVGFAFAIVALILAGVFRAAEWYAERVSLPRYCEDPEGAVAMVARVLTEPRPAGADSTRPYVVAAKLLFLVPQRAGEPGEAYVARLREHIEATCR